MSNARGRKAIIIILFLSNNSKNATPFIKRGAKLHTDRRIIDKDTLTYIFFN
jgi:hypothetical protein